MKAVGPVPRAVWTASSRKLNTQLRGGVGVGMPHTVRPRGATCNRDRRSADQCPLLSQAVPARSLSGMTCTSTSSADVSDYEMIETTRAVLGLLSARWSVDRLYALAGGTRP